MARRRAIKRLQLGPVVGHTDDVSSRIWIQAFDDPSRYVLRRGSRPLSVRAHGGRPAGVQHGPRDGRGPAPDWQYRYDVLRLGRLVHGAGGSFRTMPAPSSMTNLLFCAISCSSAEEDGSWEPFRQFVEDSLPQFVLMMGDQVYLDDDDPDVFDGHLESPRRCAAARWRRSTASTGRASRCGACWRTCRPT